MDRGYKASFFAMLTFPTPESQFKRSNNENQNDDTPAFKWRVGQSRVWAVIDATCITLCFPNRFERETRLPDNKEANGTDIDVSKT